jgi:hypothetical protein
MHIYIYIYITLKGNIREFVSLKTIKFNQKKPLDHEEWALKRLCIKSIAIKML